MYNLGPHKTWAITHLNWIHADGQVPNFGSVTKSWSVDVCMCVCVCVCVCERESERERESGLFVQYYSTVAKC